MKNKNSAQKARGNLRVVANIYNLIGASCSMEGCNSLLSLLPYLASSCKKEKALEKAAASYVELMEKAGFLTPVVPGKRYKNPYGTWTKLGKRYVEDERSAKEFCVSGRDGAAAVNLSRIASGDDTRGIMYVIAAAFFGAKLPSKLLNNMRVQSGPSESVCKKIGNAARRNSQRPWQRRAAWKPSSTRTRLRWTETAIIRRSPFHRAFELPFVARKERLGHHC